MEKTINNKRYNTKTAKLIGECTHQIEVTGDNAVTGLYRKHNGHYFLYTRFINSEKGDLIKPLSPASASVWGRKYLKASEWHEHFGLMYQDDKDKVKQVFNLRKSTVEKIKRVAAIRRTSLSAVIENLIDRGGFLYGTDKDTTD